MSTVRLMANMKRFGVSMGSHGSEAPVSPDAQAPTRVAVATAATTDRRRPVATALDRLAIIYANPASIPRPFKTRGRNAPSSMAHAAIRYGVSHTPAVV